MHGGTNKASFAWYNPFSWFYILDGRTLVPAEPRFRLNFDTATRFAKTGEEFTLGVYDNGGKLIGRYKNQLKKDTGKAHFSFNPSKDYKVKYIPENFSKVHKKELEKAEKLVYKPDN